MKKKSRNPFITGEYDIAIRSKIIFLYLTLGLSSFFLLGFTILNLVKGIRSLALYVGIAAVINAANFIFLYYRRKRINTRLIVFSSLIAISEIYFLYSYMVYTYGITNAYFAWSYTFPLFAIFFLDSVVGVTFSALFLITILSLLLYQMSHNPGLNLELLPILRVAGIFALDTTLTTVFNMVIRKMTQQISHEKEEISAMQNNIDTGIFLINQKIEIQPHYSRALETILEKENLENMNLLGIFRDSLNEKEIELMKRFVALLFESKKDPEMLREINPWKSVEFIINGKKKHLSFTFTRITREDNRFFVLVTLKDETEEVELRREIEEAESNRKKDNEFYSDLIGTEAKLLVEFINYSEKDIENINDTLRTETYDHDEKVKRISNILHGMKGNAQAINLITLGRKIHDTEDRIRNEGSKTDLIDIVIMIGFVSEEIEKMKSLMANIITFKENLDSAGIRNLMILPVMKTIERVNCDPDAHKQILLSAKDFDTEIIPLEYRKILNDILNQLVRNSIYHGIETTDERIAKNKRKTGMISIKTKVENNRLYIVYRDDGQGINTDKIREKIKQSPDFGHIENAEQLPDEDIQQLVFEANFSTSDEVNLTAGRGLGLSYVKQTIKEHRGAIRVFSKKDSHCIFKIALPL
jgi:signal transduction histidine kinase